MVKKLKEIYKNGKTKKRKRHEEKKTKKNTVIFSLVKDLLTRTVTWFEWPHGEGNVNVKQRERERREKGFESRNMHITSFQVSFIPNNEC